MDYGRDQEVLEQLRQISPEGLCHLGTPDIAYARPIHAGERTVFALHAADGARVTVLESRDAIEVAARENEMILVSVH
jgi:hypothetical protein